MMTNEVYLICLHFPQKERENLFLSWMEIWQVTLKLLEICLAQGKLKSFFEEEAVAKSLDGHMATLLVAAASNPLRSRDPD